MILKTFDYLYFIKLLYIIIFSSKQRYRYNFIFLIMKLLCFKLLKKYLLNEKLDKFELNNNYL